MSLLLPLCVAGALVAPGRTLAPTSAPGRDGRSATPLAQSATPAGRAPQPLSILDAIQRALSHNLAVLTAEQGARRADGGRWSALADLLPSVAGRVSDSRQTINLAAFGFPLPPGTPSLVGPFSVFDARVAVSQPVIDLRALGAVQAQQHTLAAARFTAQSARDLVVLATANLYLRTLAAEARAASAAAQADTARAVVSVATSMKASGMVAGIDVLRAEVQQASADQRASAAANDVSKLKLQLAQVTGLDAARPLVLSDVLPSVPTATLDADEALTQAFRARPDYLAAQERVKAAEADRRAAIGELLPSVRVTADYGAIGHTPGDAQTTYAVAGSVSVPIFTGRTRGHLITADADLAARRAELDDLRQSIETDVRSALLDLDSTRQQLEVASRGRTLADEQLTHARDRFAAGVAGSLEVVQAQEAVAAATEHHITALYGYTVAKALLARSLGVAEESARQLIGGTR